MIRTSYDPEADAMFVWFGPGKRQIRREPRGGAGDHARFDSEGHVIGIEVRDLSEGMIRANAAA